MSKSAIYRKYSKKHRSETERKIASPGTRRKVFVVHGRNTRLVNDFFQFLIALDLEPIEWSEAIRQTGKGTPYIGEILDKAFSIARAIVVLLTPDDEAKLKDEFIQVDDPIYERELTGQARPNVLFEAGLAFGRNPERTILVEIGSVRPFSDVAGRHVVRLDNSRVRRQEVATRLKTAGCDLSQKGTTWSTIGEFVP